MKAACRTRIRQRGSRETTTMRNVLLGIAVTLGALALGCGIFAFLGLLNTGADLKPGGLETTIASGALDAAVKRRAGGIANPVPASDDNLLEGMTLYSMNCAGCHGTLDRTPSKLGPDFYPPVPQIIMDPMDDPEWYIYYITKHGVRFTGMPAWGRHLKDEEIWKMAAFLSRLNKLPPAVQEKMPKPSSAP